MSYRDLRDTTEILRSLGFPRLVSIDNFRNPNFSLLAEILEWLVLKFDGDIKIKTNLEHESDRILFIKQCVIILLQKARIKMNPRNLYQANGLAIKEIMPALRLLYNPIKSINDSGKNNEELGRLTEIRSKINSSKKEVQKCNILAAEIPQSGATLYDILGKEVDLKKHRSYILSQNLSVPEVNKIIKNLIDKNEKEIEDLSIKMSNISNDEESLDYKIEKKKREHELLEKRLAKLQNFRPQYIEEYEKLENKLKILYSEYVTKFRTLSYLQEQIWELEKAEKERNYKAELQMRQQVEKLKEEISQPPLIDEDSLNEKKEKLNTFGNILGAGLSDEESEESDDIEAEKEDYEENNLSDASSISDSRMKIGDIDSEDAF
ncbi:Clusterin-associated protein 1 [Strongyloides ratti]|uniref:Clusterin-associated protein 1 n=1 Tax=Strongyloides ratti TaxID=34506 RepID=A0A090LKF9_STRRB|nr:Clusterin-associated protein 1 [Strongyloides ratti]CEF70282.1 Clusterin-associated protein 1 [Strongyloides ratti]